MKSPTFSIALILSTNWRVLCAIAAVRIDRNPATMGELRDALNARRNRRAPIDPRFTAAFALETERDIRAWGCVSRSFDCRYRLALSACN